jgi:hypothetical protein
MIKKHNVKQRSPEWFALREGLYTGSTAYLLLEGKLDQARATKASFAKFHAWRGQELENEAVELYERIKKLDVEHVGFVTNDKYPNCGYSPDGLTKLKLIEVKCFNAKRHGEITFQILAQIQFGMMITEKKKTDVIFYNPELEPDKALIIRNVDRDEKVIKNFERQLA